MVNESIVGAHGFVSTHIQNPFLAQMSDRIIDLVMAPYNNPDMIWMIVPLVTMLLLMTFYFGRYETEELGWNTAVGNSMVLLFVSIDLLRHIYNGVDAAGFGNFEANVFKSVLSLGLGGLALFLLTVNFAHAIPKSVSFFISSSLPINLLAYVSMATVYTDLMFDKFMLIGAVVLFFVLLGVIQLIKLLERLILKPLTHGEVVLLPKTKHEEEEKKPAKK